jgi:hypothetical protein
VGKVQTFCSKIPPVTSRTVRDAAIDVLRRLDLTTIFSNPGSTEVPFLAGMPSAIVAISTLPDSISSTRRLTKLAAIPPPPSTLTEVRNKCQTFILLRARRT